MKPIILPMTGPDALPVDAIVEAACRVVERMLPGWDACHSSDRTPRLVVQAARNYIAARQTGDYDARCAAREELHDMLAASRRGYSAVTSLAQLADTQISREVEARFLGVLSGIHEGLANAAWERRMGKRARRRLIRRMQRAAHKQAAGILREIMASRQLPSVGEG